MVNKLFAETAHAVIEKRYQAPSFKIHSSTEPEIHTHKNGSGQPRELPDAGFEYVKNRNASRVTKPDPPLSLPKGIRYNMATGCVEKYPNWKEK